MRKLIYLITLFSLSCLLFSNNIEEKDSSNSKETIDFSKRECTSITNYSKHYEKNETNELNNSKLLFILGTSPLVTQSVFAYFGLGFRNENYLLGYKYSSGFIDAKEIQLRVTHYKDSNRKKSYVGVILRYTQYDEIPQLYPFLYLATQLIGKEEQFRTANLGLVKNDVIELIEVRRGQENE